MGGASRNFAAVTKFLPRKLIILRILIISRNFCATKIWSYTVYLTHAEEKSTKYYYITMYVDVPRVCTYFELWVVLHTIYLSSSRYRAVETYLPCAGWCDPRAFPIRARQSHQPQGVHLERIISQDAS